MDLGSGQLPNPWIWLRSMDLARWLRSMDLAQIHGSGQLGSMGQDHFLGQISTYDCLDLSKVVKKGSKMTLFGEAIP